MRNVGAAVGVGILATVIAVFTAQSVNGSTNVSGTISTATSWTVAGSPYIVTGSVTIASGGVLTIEPGVTVKVAAQKYLDISGGRLVAVGTSTSPITFTSNQATPAAGDWQYLSFSSASGGGSQLGYVTVSYAGATNGYGVWVGAGSPQLDNVTVANTSGVGVYVRGGMPSITSSTITRSSSYGLAVKPGAAVTSLSGTISNNTNFAIWTEPGAALPVLTGVTMTGNGSGAKNAVRYAGGTISGAETWHAGATWVTNSVMVSAGGVLTIDPGVTVKMVSQQHLDVSGGRLVAVGTSASPITFTSNQATPAAGDWQYLSFSSASGGSSELGYVTVSYAGATNGYGVWVAAGSPQLDNVTVANTSGVGVYVRGGTPSITSSTITQSSSYGLAVKPGAAVTSLSGTISNNTGYAIWAEPGSALPVLTGVTMTGNGSGTRDAVRYAGGTISGAETWHAGAPWVTSSVIVGAGGVLTIDPGVTVKMVSQQYLDVAGGRLVAVGTSGSPITFTSLQATPAAGDWQYLSFSSASGGGSQLAYATVSYAGATNGYGVWVAAGSPQLDHLTVSNTSGVGVYVRGGTPSITSSTITQSSSYGLLVRSGAAVPSLTGTIANNSGYAISAEPGAALPVLTGVTMTGNGSGNKNAVWYAGGTIVGAETWHVGAPWVVNGVTVSTGGVLTIDPGVTVKMVSQRCLDVSGGRLLAVGTAGDPITFTSNQATPAAGDWQYLALRPSSAAASQLAYVTVRYAGASSGYGLLVSGGSPQLDHVTVSNISGTGVSVQGGAPAITFSTISACTSAAVSVSGTPALTISNSSFVSNGSGISNANPSNVISARFNYWNALSGPGGSAGGTGQSTTAGVDYEPWLTLPVVEADLFGPVTVTDRTFNPTIADSTTVSFATTQAGSWTATFHSTAGAVLKTFTGEGATGSATWDGRDETGTTQPDGTYLYQVESTAAGPITVAPVRGRVFKNSTITAASFTATQDVLQINSASGGRVSFTSVVPLSMRETLVIRNQQGQVVRTLLSSVLRVGGTYVDSWDGRNDAGILVPDGPYFYAASVNDGTNVSAWDLSSQALSSWWSAIDAVPYQGFDPFNNRPLTFSYSFPVAGEVTIAVANSRLQGDSCNQPPAGALCLVTRKPQAAGTHSFTWAGVDASGAYVADKYTKFTVTSTQDQFAKNAVVVFGAAATLGNVTVSPPVFSPVRGAATLSFDLSTHQNQPAAVTITFVNQSSLSTLRTITLPGQAPGHVSVAWDGRADNGMLVAPGFYTITVSAVDTIGNRAQGQILATVRP